MKYNLVSCNSDGNSSIDINWFILKSSCYRIDEIVEYRNSLLTKIKPEDFFNLRFTNDNAQIVNKFSQISKCSNPVLLDLQSSSHKDLPLPFKNSTHPVTTVRTFLTKTFRFLSKIKSNQISGSRLSYLHNERKCCLQFRNSNSKRSRLRSNCSF